MGRAAAAATAEGGVGVGEDAGAPRGVWEQPVPPTRGPPLASLVF